VRFLAPIAKLGGVRSPGIDLPLASTDAQKLSFLLYPGQEEYLPFLESTLSGRFDTPVRLAFAWNRRDHTERHGNSRRRLPAPARGRSTAASCGWRSSGRYPLA
jgi:hypothetical protein